MTAGGYRPERRVNKSRVLVLANDLLVAEALVSAFIQSGFLARCAVPGTAGDLWDMAGCTPDLALVDIDYLDQRSAMELVGVLHRAGVDVAVMGRENEVARLRDDLLHAGASAVVDKSSPFTHLLGAFCRLLRNDFTNETKLRQSASENHDEDHRSESDRSAFVAVLTGRERSILAELMNGHRAETIAANGCVSISTVRSQIKSILQKLGVNSQLAAVALAQQAGWTGDRPRGSMSQRVRDHW